ncbi:hypothetical protein PHLGIDRAFT_459486 [Phlebiopsis gigantea 11061_1 CR5-6]|uniref:Uncharacterized protein n=1 Tax=Phlebiopsis gigantea (strain 11061_1 CR5-6) TaxID=745531 RepID=A0A0C3S9U0_PHLG1|nr:hypothetical protein PHLGIDRAFT_459486 [Phlebiopsis gigantea 11061_1 CR5-6]
MRGALYLFAVSTVRASQIFPLFAGDKDRACDARPEAAASQLTRRSEAFARQTSMRVSDSMNWTPPALSDWASFHSLNTERNMKAPCIAFPDATIVVPTTREVRGCPGWASAASVDVFCAR